MNAPLASPLRKVAFREIATGIGHNGGPPLDLSWNAWTWRRAHAAAWKLPGREIVLLRSRRAEELGLSYKAYTSVILDRGVRLSGLLLMMEAAPGRYASDIGAKIARLRNCALIVCGPANTELRRIFDDRVDRAVERRDEPSIDTLRETLQSFAAQGLAPSAFFAVGWTGEHQKFAQSLGVGAFIWGRDYFCIPGRDQP